jgi:hypothetical protein
MNETMNSRTTALKSQIAAFCALAIGVVAAKAETYNYSGALVTFDVLTTGTYDITAYGAQGGTSVNGNAGGLGAEIGGDFSLTAGEVLDIIVGGQGSGDLLGGGGGGGSGVYVSGGPLLVVAGGGGGGGYSDTGGAGQLGQAGGNGSEVGGTGGTGGAGGSSGGFFSAGGGGGGLNSSGGTGGILVGGGGGSADLVGGVGGIGIGGGGGGFGFGGGGGGGEGYTGGGGGGFSGGGGGGYPMSGGAGGGGGGGSYLDVSANDTTSGTGLANGLGEVTIAAVTPSSVPDQGSSFALLAVSSLVLMLWRRRGVAAL